MHIVMLVLGILAGAFGAFIFSNSQSAIHEIEALICFLCAFVGVGAFAVANEVSAMKSELVLQGKERRQMGAVAGGMPVAAVVDRR